MKKPEILLIYDKEYLTCSTYCQIIRIQETVGNLKIIDARKNSRIMDEIIKLVLDIDSGIALEIE